MQFCESDYGSGEEMTAATWIWSKKRFYCRGGADALPRSDGSSRQLRLVPKVTAAAGENTYPYGVMACEAHSSLFAAS
jgi:hypothetical protein